MKKSIPLLVIALMLSGCSSVIKDSSEDSAVNYEIEPSNTIRSSVTLPGEMIDFPVNDEESARDSVSSAAELLGIQDVEYELGECRINDSLGINTYSFSRKYNGIPIFSDSVIVCAGEDGEALQISGNRINFSGFDSEPKISSEEIVNKVFEVNHLDESILLFSNGLTIYIDEKNSPIKLVPVRRTEL